MSFHMLVAGIFKLQRYSLRLCGAIVFGLLCPLIANSQVVVPVGSGSYASSIPAADQFVGGYYSMTAQQTVNEYGLLHLDPSVTNRPIPSNKWWTDILVADRSYEPTNGGPRIIQQDPYGGMLWAYPAAVSPGSTGFGLYYPNSWLARNSPNLPQGGFDPGPALQITGALPATVGTNDILIADFNETNFPPGWVTTGTAFGTGPIAGGTWPGESPAVQGFIGNGCVNTYRGANTPVGTLTSPSFTIQKHYISLLTGGGNDTNFTAVRLLVGTNIIYAAAGAQSGALTWSTWDVSAYLGQSAQIQIVDLSSGNWGFILCSWIIATDNGGNPALRYTSSFSPVQSSVTDWSDWGFRFGLPDAQGNRMNLTLARGVPFVWTSYTGVQPVLNVGSVTLYGTNGAVINTGSGSFSASAFAFNYQGRNFGVFAPDNTSFTVTGNIIQAALAGGANNYLVYGVLPAISNLNEFAGYAYAEVTGTEMDWVYNRTNGSVDTTWKLTTTPLKAGQTNTLQGWLPHHYRTTRNNLSFKPYTYLTPRGIMQVAAGNNFQLSYNFHGIAPALPPPQTNGLPNDYVAAWLTNYIANFASAGHPTLDNETYGAGKELAITAQYMTFARQMGMTNQVAALKQGLENLLENWFTYTPGESSYFFARYTNWPAMIGFSASYGTEAFNDNHFHYGYFMDTTALLGTEDTNFLAQFGPMARMVAKEYANWDRTDTNFPFFRTFDIWEGHSWAGGFSSAGGENQESSSEAMNSWVGLFLVGNLLGDTNMTAAGAMGYSFESAAVNEYWQDMYRTNFPAVYGEGSAGILQSGGMAYATYFDGDPAWVYAIQWVPENHWNNYLARNTNFANWQLTNMWHERVLASEYGINGFTLADANNATALGGYLGNYVLGFELLFNPDDVAAQFQSAYITNAGIATDPVYSGVTYYLTHSLRGLGEPDANYYTSIPTSQVYLNSRTGVRTAIIYNPAPTNQTATIYNAGVAAGYSVVPPGVLTVTSLGVNNRPAISLQLGVQLSWSSINGDQYELQWSTQPTNGVWTDVALMAGNGTTNTYFDPLGGSSHAFYRVLQLATITNNSVFNGGFETGTGSTATGWSGSGSQPPTRVTNTPNSGSYCLSLSVTNPTASPNTCSVQQNIASQGGAIIPGQAYNFSFWANQVSSGVSLVQNYQLSWLNSNGATVGAVGGFSLIGGNGYWLQTSLTGLVAPTNAVNALVQFSAVTGAVQGGYGQVLLDDVSLAYNTQATPSQISVTAQSGAQVSWLSLNDKLYGLQSTSNLATSNAGWSDTGPIFQGNGATNSVFQPNSTNQMRFFRLYMLP